MAVADKSSVMVVNSVEQFVPMSDILLVHWDVTLSVFMILRDVMRQRQ